MTGTGNTKNERKNKKREVTDNLPVEVVFLDHNNVHRLRVLEGEKAEATRTTCGPIAHNGAF